MKNETVKIGPYDIRPEIKEKINLYNKKTGIKKNKIAENAFEIFFKNLENKDD